VQVSRLTIENFRGIKKAEIEIDGHTLFVGSNNVGKSTICEALELALGPDRQSRNPVVEEFDFYNAMYLDECDEPIEIRIEVLLTAVTPSVEKACNNYLERWQVAGRHYLERGDIEKVDGVGHVWCLRLLTIARYNKEEDEFEAATHYAKAYDVNDEQDSRVSRQTKRNFGFLYLRALRTGSRALSLERGTLLDIILRVQSLQTGIWEHVRRRLETLSPPIDDGATKLTPVLQAIENRLAEYITIANPGSATRLFVSQLTREHMRKTLSFFLSITPDQRPVPFQEVGTGTLNTLVLALLSFIAELKDENVIFAMEEPEIALPPHTQRRIATYLQTKTTQCFVTSHSPYVIETFEADRIVILRRDSSAKVTAKRVTLTGNVKAKTYRRYVRRGFAEAMLGRGAIVTEGMTEQLTLRAVAEKLEEDSKSYYPLDLSGVTVVTTDGDGSLAEFGRFFGSLDMETFAFYDKKVRSVKEVAAIASAGFAIATETSYPGMEELLAAEVPLRHQWDYLTYLRDAGLTPNAGIPLIQPADQNVRDLTCRVLKDGKGWGRSAELVERCSIAELPATIVEFMKSIYARYPRPKIAESVSPEDQKQGMDDTGNPRDAPA
jgi:putative ATP-dependent endonuclease of OLD family